MRAKHAHARRGVGVCSPRKILQIRCSESASEATFGPKRHYSYLYVFVYVVRRVQTSKFPVYRFIELGAGHNVARLNNCALRSLRHAARLEISWPGQSVYAI